MTKKFGVLMDLAYPEKRPRAQEAPEANYEHDLDFTALDQEIIDLIEVADAGIDVGEDRGSMNARPNGTWEEGQAMVENGTKDKDFLDNRSGLEPLMSPPIAPVQEGNGPAEEAQPDMESVKVGAATAGAEYYERDAKDREVEELDPDEILAEFFSLEHTGDLLEAVTGVGEAVHLPPKEEAPGIEDDILTKYHRGLESTDRAVVKETGELVAPAPEPAWSPAQQGVAWVRSDMFYPRCVVDLQKEIVHYQEELERQISELRAQKDELKKRYEDIRTLLYGIDDQLKSAAVNVLRTYWDLQVSDVENTRTPGFKEDILVEHNGRKFLFKIKSTNRTYPPVKYITQVRQELQYSGLGPGAEGGLILNHDVRIDPRYRNLAYTGDDEECLKDIIFLDTRVLFYLTLAIIEYDFPLEEAKALLLKEGRVKFHRDDVAV